MQNSTPELIKPQTKNKLISKTGFITGVLFILLLSASFYIGVLYNQKRTLLNQPSTPQPSPEKASHTKYMGWLKPKEAKDWSTITDESTKTIKYSYKYPQNLYLSKENVRNLSGHSSYFFPDQDSFQAYKNCVDNGSLPKKEGEDLPRDWEGACDLKNLLFRINIYDGDERKTQGIDPNYLEQYQTSKETTWTIPTQRGIFGGMGESMYTDASTVYKNHTINLSLYFPNNAAIAKNEEITGLETLEFLKQIIASFQILEAVL